MSKPIYELHHPSRGRIMFKPGFSWFAFFLSPFWLLAKKLWVQFVIFIVIMFPVSLLDEYATSNQNIPLRVITLILFYISMYVCGRYGPKWYYARLIKQGYVHADQPA